MRHAPTDRDPARRPGHGRRCRPAWPRWSTSCCGEEYYALRHRVPHRADVRAGPGPHPDRLGRSGGPGRPPGRRPRPAGRRLRRPGQSGGPRGRAGPRCPLRRHRCPARSRLRHADRRRVPRHVVTLPGPTGGSDARGHPPQGRPPLGLARTSHPGTPDRLRHQRRRAPARVAPRARASGSRRSAVSSGRSTNAIRCSVSGGRPAAPRRPGGSWATSAACRGVERAVAQEVGAWRERTAAASNRPRRMVLSDLALQAIVQRPPANGDELRRTRGVDGRHLAQGRAREILDAIARGPGAGTRADPHAVRGARRAGAGGSRGRVLGCGATDRGRSRFRPGPAGHPGRHRPAALRRAQPARRGLAAFHRGRPAAPADRWRGGGGLRAAGALGARGTLGTPRPAGHRGRSSAGGRAASAAADGTHRRAEQLS